MIGLATHRNEVDLSGKSLKTEAMVTTSDLRADVNGLARSIEKSV